MLEDMKDELYELVADRYTGKPFHELNTLEQLAVMEIVRRKVNRILDESQVGADHRYEYSH